MDRDLKEFSFVGTHVYGITEMMPTFDPDGDEMDGALCGEYGSLEQVVEVLRMLPRVEASGKVVVRWEGQEGLWEESDERWGEWSSMETREEFLRQIGRLNDS